MYPLRELQSKRRISKTVTLKDTKGNLKTITLTVEGPVSVSGCTTREKIYEDNANRCLLVYIDASKEQDRRIMDYQARISSGEIDREREQAIKNSLQNMQRVLKPVAVVNQYAKYIQLPEQVFKPRRTMGLLLSFIEAITLLHQYQREVKRDSHHQPYIETTVEDIEAAFSLLKDVLFSKSDELTRATRGFLELLKVILREQGKISFTAREIREQLRINPSNLKRYLVELERYGYIKGSGNRYRGNYEYIITNVQEYEQLKTSIDQHLAAEEITRLEATHVHLREGRLFIRAMKRTDERWLPLSALQLIELGEYLQANRFKTGPLLIDGRKQHASPTNINNRMQGMIKQLRRLNPRVINAAQFRSSVIAHWLKANNLRQVQYMARHKYVSSTQRYQLTTLDDLKSDLQQHHPLR